MHYTGVRDGKIENLKKKEKINISNTWPPSRCIQSLEVQAPIEAEKTVTEIFLERKKNGQIQELISNMWLILCYTVQLVIPNVRTKFQNPKSSSFREIFDRKKLTNTHTHTHTHKHINRKGKNYIPPIYFVCRGYKQVLFTKV